MVRGSVLRGHNQSGWWGLHIWSWRHWWQAQRGKISALEKTSKLWQLRLGGNSSGLGGCLVRRRATKKDVVCGFWTWWRGFVFGSIFTLSLESSFCKGERLCWCWACLCPPRKDVAAKKWEVGLPPWWGNVCHAGQRLVPKILSLVIILPVMQGVVPGVDDPVIYIGNK